MPTARDSRRLLGAFAFGALGLWCSPALGQASSAHPQPYPAPTSWARDWHAGLNLRTDFGTHPVRLGGGVRFRSWDLVAVFDPMVLLDHQHDLDALAYWEFTRGWSTFLGWRATTIGILDGYQWQHKSLHGVSGRLPDLFGGHLRSRWGLELAVLWVKHGADLPTQTLSLASARDWLDHFNFGMFVSIDYASPF